MDGQLRFSIPKVTPSKGPVSSEHDQLVKGASLGLLLKMLERYKAELNLEYLFRG